MRGGDWFQTLSQMKVDRMLKPKTSFVLALAELEFKKKKILIGPGVSEMFGIINGDVKLLVDVVAKVGMDRGDGLVLGIHLLAGKYCQSVSGLE